MKTNHLLLHALVACSLSSFATTAAADAADDWVAYRQANGLPVDPKPSAPGTLPTYVTFVPDAPLAPLDAEREKAIALAYGKANGNGNGSHTWSKPCGGLFVEMAKTDGDTTGATARCE